MTADNAKPGSNVEPLRKTRACPECGRPSHREHYPFCSDRCRNIDLNRWLTGSYAIPVADDEAKADGEDALNWRIVVEYSDALRFLKISLSKKGHLVLDTVRTRCYNPARSRGKRPAVSTRNRKA